ncbi:MAG: hypothetical protein AAF633_22185, partial [Chloroflexota bacterium]
PNSPRSNAVYIVARVGLTPIPVDFGWLIHQVRETENGSEMRSRFWMAGRHIAGRTSLINWMDPLIRSVQKMPESQVVDLATHCAEEMAHLATFLPNIYAEFSE